ncbi:uncharacterized protein LOC128042948 [Gossypium raimondii]|uniref:uncharacterized protein LOC128042948 n=1 Tax=Gossypium raimondii TaxID=29730 RepID=UPI00227C8898|nr:uncharacterized protein LOC128042948 [Gossypium raimondii]
MLRCYRSDPTHIAPVEEIKVRQDLTFEETPMKILDREFEVLRKESVPLLKVLWRNHSTKEATRETEEPMRQQYPHLFWPVPVEEIEVRPDLTFEEKSVMILYCAVKLLRKKSIPVVKLLWRNHSSEEATWEPKEAMRQQYPHLF